MRSLWRTKMWRCGTRAFEACRRICRHCSMLFASRIFADYRSLRHLDERLQPPFVDTGACVIGRAPPYIKSLRSSLFERGIVVTGSAHIRLIGRRCEYEVLALWIFLIVDAVVPAATVTTMQVPRGWIVRSELRANFEHCAGSPLTRQTVRRHSLHARVAWRGGGWPCKHVLV